MTGTSFGGYRPAGEAGKHESTSRHDRDVPRAGFARFSTGATAPTWTPELLTLYDSLGLCLAAAVAWVACAAADTRSVHAVVFELVHAYVYGMGLSGVPFVGGLVLGRIRFSGRDSSFVTLSPRPGRGLTAIAGMSQAQGAWL